MLTVRPISALNNLVPQSLVIKRIKELQTSCCNKDTQIQSIYFPMGGGEPAIIKVKTRMQNLLRLFLGSSLPFGFVFDHFVVCFGSQVI